MTVFPNFLWDAAGVLGVRDTLKAYQVRELPEKELFSDSWHNVKLITSGLVSTFAT